MGLDRFVRARLLLRTLLKITIRAFIRTDPARLNSLSFCAQPIIVPNGRPSQISRALGSRAGHLVGNQPDALHPPHGPHALAGSVPVATFTAIGITPRATIEMAHRLDFLLAILLWVVPSASAIGFAARKPQRRALSLVSRFPSFSSRCICFFLGRQDHSAFKEGISVIATIIVLSAVVLSFFESNFFHSLTVVNSIAILLLFWSFNSRFVSQHQNSSPTKRTVVHNATAGAMAVHEHRLRIRRNKAGRLCR